MHNIFLIRFVAFLIFHWLTYQIRGPANSNDDSRKRDTNELASAARFGDALLFREPLDIQTVHSFFNDSVH